jgi:broad specificity phosphatase PhoE
LSNLYLVRHGQAGTRDSYDSLSTLGLEQARLLGEYFLSQQVDFAAAYAGTMLRQQQTAVAVSKTYEKAGVPFPPIITDQDWNEFDLAQVYRELGPLLCEADAEFKSEYEELRRQMNQSAGAHDAAVHRRWRPCDTKMVDTWIAGRFPYSGESWDEFRGRVIRLTAKLGEAPRQANILAFTSATPTAILTGLTLEVPDERVRQLAGALFNASYSVLRQRGEHLYLFQFNAVPHLTAPLLRTHR